MQAEKGGQIVINYDPIKLSDKRTRADFLFRLLKQSNPLSKKSYKLSINDLLLSQLHTYFQQKQSLCNKKTSEIRQLAHQFEQLELQITNQKHLTIKYYQNVQAFLQKVLNQTKNQLSVLSKHRIQQQIEFAQKIDQKLQMLAFDISSTRQLHSQTQKQEWSQGIRQISHKINQNNTKLDELGVRMSQDQAQLLTQVNQRVTELKSMIEKLKYEGKSLYEFLVQVEDFHTSVMSKIREMKKERNLKEKQTIQIIQKILCTIDSRKEQSQ